MQSTRIGQGQSIIVNYKLLKILPYQRVPSGLASTNSFTLIFQCFAFAYPIPSITAGLCIRLTIIKIMGPSTISENKLINYNCALVYQSDRLNSQLIVSMTNTKIPYINQILSFSSNNQFKTGSHKTLFHCNYL